MVESPGDGPAQNDALWLAGVTGLVAVVMFIIFVANQTAKNRPPVMRINQRTGDIELPEHSKEIAADGIRGFVEVDGWKSVRGGAQNTKHCEVALLIADGKDTGRITVRGLGTGQNARTVLRRICEQHGIAYTRIEPERALPIGET